MHAAHWYLTSVSSEYRIPVVPPIEKGEKTGFCNEIIFRWLPVNIWVFEMFESQAHDPRMEIP